jgi:DNA-directed RNA polymerase subunit M/transcription elongation factor TFIIS
VTGSHLWAAHTRSECMGSAWRRWVVLLLTCCLFDPSTRVVRTQHRPAHSKTASLSRMWIAETSEVVARTRFIQWYFLIVPEASVRRSSLIIACEQAAVWSSRTGVCRREVHLRELALSISISSGPILIGGPTSPQSRKPWSASLGIFPGREIEASLCAGRAIFTSRSRADDRRHSIPIHKQSFSHVISPNTAKMAAIGSLVFCTDCGNLLETNTSRKTYLTCEVCGAQNKGTDRIATKAHALEQTLTIHRHLQQNHHHSLQAHSVPLDSPHAPALRRARVRRGRDPNRRHHRPPLRKVRQPSDTLLHPATTIRRRRQHGLLHLPEVLAQVEREQLIGRLLYIARRLSEVVF